MPKIVTITLMRKGSKRFPDKVRQPLFGVPLYMYTVEHARALGYPYYLAHDYNDLYLPEFVNEIKRKPEYAGHEHKTCEEIKSFNLNADIYIFLQATSPFRDLSCFSVIINNFIKYKFSCAVSAKILKEAYYYIGNSPINFPQEKRTDNGCKKGQICNEAGGMYIFTKGQLNKKHILDGDNKMIIPTNYDIDIDTKEDLRRAEKCIQNYY